MVKRFKDPDLIDRLTPVVLKTHDGERLWPGVLAFECCGDTDALRLARRAVEAVIHVLQDLFDDLEVEKRDFTIAEVEAHARKMFSGIESETIWLGLYLVQEFRGVHAGLGGNPPNFTSVRIHDRIGLLKNVPAAWDDYVATYSLYLEREHGVKMNGKEPGS